MRKNARTANGKLLTLQSGQPSTETRQYLTLATDVFDAVSGRKAVRNEFMR